MFSNPTVNQIIKLSYGVSASQKKSTTSLNDFAVALLFHQDVYSFLALHDKANTIDTIRGKYKRHTIQKHDGKDGDLSSDLTNHIHKITSSDDFKNTPPKLHALQILRKTIQSHPNLPAIKDIQETGINEAHIQDHIDAHPPSSQSLVPQTAAFYPQPYQLNPISLDEESALQKHTTYLNELAFDNKIDPVIGRDSVINMVLHNLRKRKKGNSMLLGDAGVGKTAIAEGLALLSISGQLPSDLPSIEIFSVTQADLEAGTTFRGDLEQRVKDIIAEISEMDGGILFIDEIHTLFTSGWGIADLFKPALARGDIWCIGATTRNEYKKHIEPDTAFCRRFTNVNVDEPSPEMAIEIVSGLKETYEQHHGCTIENDAIKAAINLSARYITDRQLPDKAFDLIDTAGAILRDTHTGTSMPIMTEDLVYKAVSQIKNLPLEALTSSERQKYLQLKPSLDAVVFNQEAATGKLSNALALSRSGLGDPDRPVGSFLFAGPTGVGKTEITKQLAKHLDIELIRFDMSEYMERHTASRLIGAPPGYVGYDEGGLLTEAVKKTPYSVVLLDEIEKAHPDIFNLLLQVMDDGALTDSNGYKVDFKNVILVMTTNVGASHTRSIGFTAAGQSTDSAEELNRTFSPEFRNRLDAIVEFDPLKPEILPRIVEKLIENLEDKLEEKGIYISFTPEAKNWLAEKGFDQNMGARPLKRVFRDNVETPIAYNILEDEAEKLQAVTISEHEGGLAISSNMDTANQNQQKEKVIDRRQPVRR